LIGSSMTALTAHQLFTVLAWFLMTIILGFMILIAKFYEDVTSERTYYLAFTVPILCFAGASARYAFNNDIGSDAFADVLWVVGGVTLGALSLYLYRVMLKSPPAPDTKEDDGRTK
jgi:uncharacterized membrane protein